MNPTMFLSIMFLFMSTLLVLSSSSWFVMWMAIEVNMMSFIPIIFSNYNKLSSESMIKYFLIQASGSLVFLFSMILSSSSLIQFSSLDSPSMPSILLTASMVLKLGCAPFHQWFPSIVEGMQWHSLLFLLTWQKIAPLSILVNSNNNLIMILFSSSLSALIGSLSGFNQSLLRKIMAFSSISHLGWMLIIIFNKPLIYMYMMIYIVLNLSIVLSFAAMNLYHFSHLNFNKFNSSLIMINLLSLGGLPPFLGFFPKWISITWLMQISPILLIILIFSALINLSFYLRMLYKIMLLKTQNHLFPKKMKYTKISVMNMLSIFPFIPVMFLTLF